MSEFYGATDDAEPIRTVHRALELGVTLFDTADMYGPYKNEELVGRALAGRRDRAFIATKFGIVRAARARCDTQRDHHAPIGSSGRWKRRAIAAPEYSVRIGR